MLQYNTQLKNAPPPTGQMLQQMQQTGAPWGYNQNHQDLMGGLMAQRAVNMDRYAQQMQDDYQSRQQQAEMQNALSGLQMLSRQKQDSQNLSNTRMQNMLGFTSDILGGLLR